MASCNPPQIDHSNNCPLKSMPNVGAVVKMCQELCKKPGVHSVIQMASEGFKYNGHGDTAKCVDCGLEVSNWTSDMKPFKVHSQRKPNCPFVLFIRLLSFLKDLGTSAAELNFLSSRVIVLNLLEQIQRRTFSYWRYRTIPTVEQIIQAGFFCCNIGDRVLCIYCDLICQQWILGMEDPSDVHRTLSPDCPFVRSKLIHSPTLFVPIVNINLREIVSKSHPTTLPNLAQPRSDALTITNAWHPAYLQETNRRASFATCPKENLPPVVILSRAGFFYTGIKTIVKCFCCNGSLENWGSKDNPLIEHVRWFPDCTYAKQLCGDELHGAIRVSQDYADVTETRGKSDSAELLSGNVSPTSQRLLVLNKDAVSTLVTARLNSPGYRCLLFENFALDAIKDCLENQLRLKQEDFPSQSDLYIACSIVQKQNKHVDGNQENIVIPSIRMTQIREQNERVGEQSSTAINSTRSVSNPTHAEELLLSTSLSNGTVNNQINNQHQSNNSPVSNPCVLCLTEKRRLACIPCGHLATCVPCGHSLRRCIICRREIDTFLEISNQQ